MEEKELQLKCRNLLENFDDVLLYICQTEEYKLRTMDIDDSDQYKFLKKSFFNKGVIEGMRRLVAKINSEANKG